MATAIRAFTLQARTSHRLDDAVPLGKRSQFVNEAIRAALRNTSASEA